MKRVLSFVLVAALCVCSALSFAACGSSGDQIVIGGLAPLTGDVSQYGIASNNGTKLAVKEINAAGGILGKQIKYVSYDEKGDPTEAVTAYRRLVDNDKIVALVGDITTKPTIAVAQEAVKDNIPMITPTGTGAAITEIGDNIFRACFTDPFQGELMANYAQQKLGATSAAILYDTTDDYSKGVADAFEETAKALGMTVTAKEGYQQGNTDFNAQLTKIKDGNPDVIMAPCYYSDAALILIQATALGIDAKFLGPDGWDGVLNQVDPSNYSALNNAYYCSQYALSQPEAKLQAFIDAYKAEYGADAEPNMFAVLGYEAMYLMAAAIEKAGSTDADAVVAAMKTLNYDGVSGEIAFRDSNDPAREAYIVKFTNGEEELQGTFSI